MPMCMLQYNATCKKTCGKNKKKSVRQNVFSPELKKLQIRYYFTLRGKNIRSNRFFYPAQYIFTFLGKHCFFMIFDVMSKTSLSTSKKVLSGFDICRDSLDRT